MAVVVLIVYCVLLKGIGLFISVVIIDRAMASTVCTSVMVASLMAGK